MLHAPVIDRPTAAPNARPYGVIPSSALAEAVRHLIRTRGVAGAARALLLSREGTVRLGAGVRVTRGTLLVAETRLREIADSAVTDANTSEHQ